MATYIPTNAVSSTYFGGNYNGITVHRITSITDSDGSDDKFAKGENVTVMWSNGSQETLQFVGTTTAIEGGPYLVLKNDLGAGFSAFETFYVVATGPSETEGRTVAGQKVVPATVSGSDGLNINDGTFTVCFFPGTLIATPYDERKIEELVSGDMVLVEDSRAVPVRWIGYQTISTRFGPAERLMPVRFSAGSLGGDLFCRIAT